jgi:transposase InsO family protein
VPGVALGLLLLESRRRRPDQATWDEALVVDAIFNIWARSRHRYGSPRVSAALAKQGWKVNEKRVARLMGELAIAGKHGRRKLVTTWRDKDATPAPDLVQRDFTAEAPDQLWVGDITYIPTGEGWLFVASVLGRLLPPPGGLVYRRPPAYRAVHRRLTSSRGQPWSSALCGHKVPLRPRMPIYRAGLQETLPGHGYNPVHGHRRRFLR